MTPMQRAGLLLLTVAAMVAAQQKSKQATQAFTGMITDSMCATDHSDMKMGPNDHECTIACVLAHGAEYVLSDGRNVYILSDQKKGEEFAGYQVTVTGSLRDRGQDRVVEVASIEKQ